MINAFVLPVRDKIYRGADSDIWKPAIWKNSRGKYITPMAPHEAARHRERTAVERKNIRFKVEFRAHNVMVSRAVKVKAHLMFGVIAILADQFTKLVT